MNIEHNFPFDPTNGMTLTELLQVPSTEEPADFQDFWKETYDLVASAPLNYTVETELWSPVPEEKIFRVKAVNWDGVEFTMWINRPENSKGAVLQGQGYGHPIVPLDNYFGYLFAAGEKKFSDQPCCPLSLTSCLPMVRGLGASQCKDIPWLPEKHVLHGIASRETYILRGVIADEWMAVRVLLDMFPDCASNLNYIGGSMGGGMGALLLPWEKRFRSAVLHVPTFGCVARYDYQTSGTGEHCRQYLEAHPEAMEVLKYFDGSISAKYITIPVCCTPALFDPCVAPVGQFSIVNAIAEEYKTLLVRDTGHFAMTEKDKKVEEQLKVWCKENFLL